MTLYEYAKASKEQKEAILKSEALFLDQFEDHETITYVYFLNDFFVEVTIKDGKVIDNIPFKRGYKIDKKDLHAIEKRNTFYQAAA